MDPIAKHGQNARDPVKKIGLHSGLNDDHVIESDRSVLLGRGPDGEERAPVKNIVPVSPLEIVHEDGIDKLKFTGEVAEGGIPEAPSDGKSYGRRNGAWNLVIAHDADIVDGGNY